MRAGRHELLRRLRDDESGPTAVEYAIMAGLIATVIIFTVGMLGISVRGLFERVTW